MEPPFPGMYSVIVRTKIIKLIIREVYVRLLQYIALCAVIGGMALIAPTIAQADSRTNETLVSLTGTVSEFKVTRRNEIDGFFLNDGSEVRFPKHLGSSVSSAIAIGAQVRVDGVQKTGRRGDVHVKAHTITNLMTGATVVIEARETIEGAISDFTRSRSGRGDGIVINNDIVRIPRHLADTFTANFKPGDPVRVEGIRHTDPKGASRFKAARITNLTTGTVIVFP